MDLQERAGGVKSLRVSWREKQKTRETHRSGKHSVTWSKSKVLKCSSHMFSFTCGTWTIKLIKAEYDRLEGKGHEVILVTVLSFVKPINIMDSLCSVIFVSSILLKEYLLCSNHAHMQNTCTSVTEVKDVSTALVHSLYIYICISITLYVSND